MAEQNLANHPRTVPLFHFFILPALTLNIGWSIYRLVHGRHWADGIIGVLTAAALLLLALFARMFALTVQDRVIRLEERLRFERLLPEDLRARIAEFTVGQFVALRFASDAELPALARKVLSSNLTDRKAIKQLVQNWRADHLRA
jgi:multisubunit Na+/H+ antiporter MnhF subunit